MAELFCVSECNGKSNQIFTLMFFNDTQGIPEQIYQLKFCYFSAMWILGMRRIRNFGSDVGAGSRNFSDPDPVPDLNIDHSERAVARILLTG